VAAGSGSTPRRFATDYEANEAARDFQVYCCEVLRQL
jgi:hypothetical protein